jgi:phytoene dehydrogenase-like protein
LYWQICFGVCFTPEAYAQACRCLLVERGVEIRTNTTVASVAAAGGAIRGVRTSNGNLIRARCTR